ncbi:MBL fold metallo-hydrolase [Asaia spathodeae]|uniref:MBL fold metallo-hydrolase n=1 Tax=Asaia spathodeae TaxID=657016 RepID=UPI002FC2ECEB
MKPFPESDHCDGRSFHNPASYRLSPPLQVPLERPSVEPDFTSILSWQRSLRLRWPNDVPTFSAEPFPELAPGEISASFINHSSFLIRIGRVGERPLAILTDPILSERCSPFRHFGPRRVVPPGLAFDAIPAIDIILVSHCHYDHLDRPTLRRFGRRDRPLCLAPLGNRRHLRGLGFSVVATLDWWQEFRFDPITITAIPALHGSARTPFDQNQALWSGFHIDTGLKRLIFAGDTAHGHHWAEINSRLGAPDLALLPIGAYEPISLMQPVHMTPEQAVEAAMLLEARHAVAMHFGTFQLTDEGYWEPGGRLERCLNSRGRDLSWFSLPERGQSLRAP